MAPPLPCLPVLPLHLRQLVFHGVEDAHQVDVDDAPGLVRRHLRQPDEALRDAGIVDGDVEAAEPLHRKRDQPFRQRFLGNVAGQHGALDRQRRRELLQPAGVDVGKHEPRAVRGQPLQSRRPKPPVAPVTSAVSPSKRAIACSNPSSLIDRSSTASPVEQLSPQRSP